MILQESSFYLYDHLGNTRMTYCILPTSDATFTVEEMMDYDPYGKILRQYSTGGEKYLTTQHQRDTETCHIKFMTKTFEFISVLISLMFISCLNPSKDSANKTIMRNDLDPLTHQKVIAIAPSGRREQTEYFYDEQADSLFGTFNNSNICWREISDNEIMAVYKPHINGEEYVFVDFSISYLKYMIDNLESDNRDWAYAIMIGHFWNFKRVYYLTNQADLAIWRGKERALSKEAWQRKLQSVGY
jgi:hypothetical protein